MSKKSLKSRNMTLARIAVLCVCLAGFMALYFSFMSTREPFDENTRLFIFENIGRGAMIAYIVLGSLLAIRQPLYWPFLNRDERNRLDERQNKVRENTYEKAYRRLPLYILGAVIIFGGEASSTMTTMLWWFGMTTYFLLPVLYASWRKDA